jgi:hypothetical protein
MSALERAQPIENENYAAWKTKALDSIQRTARGRTAMQEGRLELKGIPARS